MMLVLFLASVMQQISNQVQKYAQRPKDGDDEDDADSISEAARTLLNASIVRSIRAGVGNIKHNHVHDEYVRQIVAELVLDAYGQHRRDDVIQAVGLTRR